MRERDTARREEDRERWIEAFERVYAFVPLSQYDEVTKLAHYAFEEMIQERDALLSLLERTEEERDDLLRWKEAWGRAGLKLVEQVERAEAAESQLRELRKAACDPFLVITERLPDVEQHVNAEMKRAADRFRAALSVQVPEGET